MRRRRPTRWGKIIGLSALVMIGIAFALPFLVPLKPWFPDLESQLGQAIGEPVAFNGLHAGLSPRPYLEASGVTVGKDRDVQILRARLYPDLVSLFEPTRYLNSIELETVVIGRDAVLRFISERKGEGGLQRIRLGRIRATHVKLDVVDGKLGDVEFDAMLNRENQMTSLVIEAADRKSKLEVLPASDPSGVQLTFSAQAWRPPLGPAVTFERFYAQGILTEGKLAVSEITAGGYGGDARGGLELTWRSGWALSGRMQANRFDIYPLLQAVQAPLPVRGTLEGDFKFAAAAESLAKLGDALKLEGRFKLSNGTLNDFDFPRVIQGAGRDGVRGGQTRFEQLAGNVQTGSGYKFTALRLSSGLMSAAGNIAIADGGQISGAMSVELKGSAGVLGSTVLTSGTLKEPVLLSSGR